MVDEVKDPESPPKEDEDEGYMVEKGHRMSTFIILLSVKSIIYPI